MSAFLSYLQSINHPWADEQASFEAQGNTGPWVLLQNDYNTFLQSQPTTTTTATAPTTTTAAPTNTTTVAPTTTTATGLTTTTATEADTVAASLYDKYNDAESPEGRALSFQRWLSENHPSVMQYYYDWQSDGNEGLPPNVAALQPEYDAYVAGFQAPTTTATAQTSTTTAPTGMTLEQFYNNLSVDDRALLDQLEDPIAAANWVVAHGFTGTSGHLGNDWMGNPIYIQNGQVVQTLADVSDSGATMEQQYGWNPETQALFAGATANPDGTFSVTPQQLQQTMAALEPNDPLFDFISQYGPALTGGAFMGAGLLGTGTGTGSEALIGDIAADTLETGGTGALGTTATGTEALSGMDVMGGLGSADAAAVGLGTAGATATTVGATAGGISAATAAINSALGTNLTDADLGRILTGVGQAGLGYLGSQEQADAYRDVSNQYMNLGAPYRGLLENSYRQNFDLMNQPGYGDAFERSADIATRAVSANRGNPYGNPTAMAEIQNQLWSQNYLPALSNYRGSLMQAGGMGLNTSGAASLGAAQQTGGAYDALGYGLGTIFSPQPNINDLLRSMGGGAPNYNLTVGGSRIP